MKFPLLQPLRRNGKRMKPPADVELDTEADRADIEHLARRGVIGAPVSDADIELSGQYDADAIKPIEPEAPAVDAAPEPDGASAATDDGAEPAAEPTPEPAPEPEPKSKPARKVASKPAKGKE